jgi:Domain of unknown function (DUF5666)
MLGLLTPEQPAIPRCGDMMFDDLPHPSAWGAPRPPSRIRIGLLGLTAAALVAVGVLAAGWALAPSGTAAADPTVSPGTPAQGGWRMDADGPHGRGPGTGPITITAINGSVISLKTDDGWTRTITVTGSTTYLKAGATSSLSDLQVGDQITFRETRQSDGSYSIDEVDVVMPRLTGTVTAISGSTITLRQPDGSTGTVTVTSSTKYQVNANTSATLSDIQVGMILTAEGSQGSNGTLTAVAIRAGDLGQLGGPGFGFGFGHGQGRGFHGAGPWPDGSTPNAAASPSTGA